MSEILDEMPKESETDTGNVEVEAECSKPKRRRRGKKKRRKSQDTSSDKIDEEDDAKELDGASGNHIESKKRQKLLIRPVDVPKAPKNSTQFIMDDHDECHLYFSFERPNPYHEKAEGTDDASNDAAFQDIDYEYHSMQDVDNTAYYLQDFELSYSKVRYEESMRLTQPDLVSTLQTLEARVKELEHKLYEKDPGSALDQLQRKLLRLQEENTAMRETQQHLRSILAGGQDSGSDQSHHSDSDHENEQLDDLMIDHSDDSNQGFFDFENGDSSDDMIPELNSSDDMIPELNSSDESSDNAVFVLDLDNSDSEVLDDQNDEQLQEFNNEQSGNSGDELLLESNSEQLGKSDDELLQNANYEPLGECNGAKLIDFNSNRDKSDLIQDSNSEVNQDSNNEVIQDLNSEIIQNSSSEAIQNSTSEFSLIHDTELPPTQNPDSELPSNSDNELKQNFENELKCNIGDKLLCDPNSELVQNFDNQRMQNCNDAVVCSPNNEQLMDSNDKV